MGRYGKSDI